jgi:hypothetical protein
MTTESISAFVLACQTLNALFEYGTLSLISTDQHAMLPRVNSSMSGTGSIRGFQPTGILVRQHRRLLYDYPIGWL